MKRTLLTLPRTMLKGSSGLGKLARVSHTRSCVYSFNLAHHDTTSSIHDEVMATKKAPKKQSPKAKTPKKQKFVVVDNNQRSIRCFLAPRGGNGLSVAPEHAQLKCPAGQRSRLNSKDTSSLPASRDGAGTPQSKLLAAESSGQKRKRKEPSVAQPLGPVLWNLSGPDKKKGAASTQNDGHRVTATVLTQELPELRGKLATGYGRKEQDLLGIIPSQQFKRLEERQLEDVSAAAAAVTGRKLPGSQCGAPPGQGFSRRNFAALAAGRPCHGTPAALPPTQSSGPGIGQVRGVARASNQVSWAHPDAAKAEEILRKLPLNEEQMAAATSDTEKPKMIRAGAGTGKTTTMVGRIIYMTLGKGINPREILGVTFTKKAAAELKERVVAVGVRDVKVTTFHSFCYDVLKRFHHEAGFPAVPLIWSNNDELRAVMGEAMRTVSLRSAQVRLAGWLHLPESAGRGPRGREAIKQAVEAQYPDVFRRAMDTLRENMEIALSKRDREALEKEGEQDEQAVGKVAEKSELSRGVMSPDKRGWKRKKVERVTELEQLQQLYEHMMKRVEPGTWQSLYGAEAKKRLAQKRPLKGGKKTAVRDTLPYNYKMPGKIPDNNQVKLAFKWMESQKTRGLEPSDFGPHGDALAYQQFQRLLREACAVDFGNMLMLVRDLLRQDPAVKLRLQALHPYLLIDEYQDSNPLQVDIVDALQGEMQRVTVVGDDFQAIFGFRGSQPNVFQRFIDTFEHDDLQQPLQDNYRSRPAILDVGIAALQDSLNLLHKELRPTKAATPHKVTIWETGHCDQEAEQIAEKAKLLHEAEGVPYEEMALLLRVFRGQYSPLYRTYEKAFLKAGVPVTIVKGRAFLEGKDVMNALAYVRLMLNTRDDVAFRRVFNQPRRSLGPKFEEDLQKYRDEKRLQLDTDDSPENSNDPAADCSLMQCCQEMLAKGVVRSRFKKGIRSFIDFVNETRIKSLQWTPSQTLMHILVDSGLLETIKAEAKAKSAKARRQGDEGHALQTLVSDEEEEEERDDGSEASEDDEAWLGGSKEDGDLYRTLLPDELDTLCSVAREFEAEYVNSLDIDPFTGRPTGEDGLGTETLLRMSEQAVVGGDARAAIAELPQELLFNAHASFAKGPLPLRSFLEHLSLSAEEVTGSKKGVVISTIHAAKGLEWDVVFVPGLNNGLMPCSWRPDSGLLPLGHESLALAEGQDAFKILDQWGVRHKPPRQMTRLEEAVMEHFDEEARLFHVAITRGREQVVLSYNRHQLVVPKEKKKPSFAKQLGRSFFLQRIESRCAAIGVFPQDERERALTAQFPRRAPSFDSEED